MIGKLRPIRRTSGEPAEMSDEALVAACAAGDRAGLAALFDRHHARVHAFLARLTGVDAPVVEDLLQETFLLAFDGAGSYRRRGAVTTWLLGIAANVGRHHVRAESRDRARAAVFLARFPDEPADPGGDAERHELVARLGRALASMAPELREAFLLCDVEEVRGVDAARTLGIRTGTLYRRLHDARRLLRAALGSGS